MATRSTTRNHSEVNVPWVGDADHVPEEVVQVVGDGRDAGGDEKAREDDPGEVTSEHGREELADRSPERHPFRDAGAWLRTFALRGEQRSG